MTMSNCDRKPSTLTHLSILVVALSLSACSEPFVYRAQDHDYRVRHAVGVADAIVKASIDFAGHDTTLEPAEKGKLARYFDSYIGVGQGPIYAVVFQDGSDQEALLTRAELVNAVAEERGIRKSEIITFVAEGGGESDFSVALTYERSVSVVPRCADWSRSTDRNYDNLPPSNFGCALAANLGKMIVNPADLERRAPATLADAPSLSRVILLHRAGQPTSSSDNPAGPANVFGATQ